MPREFFTRRKLTPPVCLLPVPNAVATLAIPLAIFDKDVRPKEGDVLAALIQGVSVKGSGADVAHESDVASAPVPVDPRLA